jgi:hypothetical protein
MPSRYPERGEIDVVHIGNVTRDIDPADPRGWRAGGGVTYASLTSARLGLRSAAVIGADPIAAEARELDLLRAAGVDVRIVPIEQGPVFDNLETEHGRVQTCVEPKPVPSGRPRFPEVRAWPSAGRGSCASSSPASGPGASRRSVARSSTAPNSSG